MYIVDPCTITENIVNNMYIIHKLLHNIDLINSQLDVSAALQFYYDKDIDKNCLQLNKQHAYSFAQFTM